MAAGSGGEPGGEEPDTCAQGRERGRETKEAVASKGKAIFSLLTLAGALLGWQPHAEAPPGAVVSVQESKPKALPSRSLDPVRDEWMDFEATWYTPHEGEGNGLVTASGHPVSEKVAAVDPAVIPLGSEIEIRFEDGHIERRIAADTGGAIKGRRIDLFCWSREEAIKNGRQRVKVRVVR